MTKTSTHMNSQRQRYTMGGFTLIELLVVISIIGLLSSTVLASLNTARAKARDAALFEGTHQLMLALELYRNQNNQLPPSNPQSFCGSLPYCTYTSIQGNATDPTLLTNLTPYMSSLPNPGTFSNPDKNGGWTTSRLMYRVLTNSAGMPTGCAAAAANCYVLAVYPEASSALSPANQAVYFLSNGEVRKGLNTGLY